MPIRKRLLSHPHNPYVCLLMPIEPIYVFSARLFRFVLTGWLGKELKVLQELSSDREEISKYSSLRVQLTLHERSKGLITATNPSNTKKSKDPHPNVSFL